MTHISTRRGRLARPFRLALAAVMVLGLLVAATAGAAAAGSPGAVYTSSNAAGGNAVLVFDRAADGSLTLRESVPTGGLGTGSGLGSQGALALTDGGRQLLVVNAGSDTVSVFRIQSGDLTLTDVENSGGDRPISLTVSGNLVYVLNSGGVGNISGFTLDAGGDLSPLAGSTRPLSGAAVDPAQVSFSPDGRVLVVTEKATNLIDTYTVGRDGLADGPTAHPSSGVTPFGFAFTQRGDLIVSEAYGGAPDASALSSYHVAADGALTLVSGSVGTTETSACWVVVTKNGKFAYTTNAVSGSISGYAVDPQGRLTLLDADGKTGDPGAGPIDMALSGNGHILYALAGGDASLSAFQVNPDGSLTSLATVAGLPSGAAGLVAR